MSGSKTSQTHSGKSLRKGSGLIKLILGVGVFTILDRIGVLDVSIMKASGLIVVMMAAYELYRAVFGYWFAEKPDRISTGAFWAHSSGVLIFALGAAIIWRGGASLSRHLMVFLTMALVAALLEVRPRAETVLLRMRLRRAIRGGRIDRANKLASVLFNRMVVKRLVQDSPAAKFSFAKSAKLLGELKEVEGDYQAADWFYGWALADSCETRSRNVSPIRASWTIDMLCSKVRVATFIAPQEANRYLKLAEELVEYSPKDMAKVIMAGGRTSGLQNRAASLAGYTLAEVILQQNSNANVYIGIRKFDRFLCTFHLARSYGVRGKTDEALAVLESLNESLSTSLDIRNSFLRIQAEELRSDLLDRVGKFERAVEVISDLTDQLQDQLTKIAKDGNEATLLSLSEMAARITSRYVGLVDERFPEDSHRRISVLEAVIRLKGIATRVRLGVSRALSPAVEDDLKDTTLKALELRRELADSWVDPSRSEQAFEMNRFELSKVEAFLIKERLGGKWIQEQLTSSLSQLKAILLPEERAVEFVKARFSGGIDRYVCFTFTSAKSDLLLLDLGSSDEIDEAIAEWRELVQVGANPGLGHEATALIQQRLVEPLLNLAGNTQRFIVALDGEVGTIPLEAFFDLNGDGLLDRFEWVYVASLSDITRRQEPIGRTAARNVVVASPDFDWVVSKDGDGTSRSVDMGQPKNSEPIFEKLPYAASEGQDVAKLLGDTVLYTNSDASVPRLKAIVSPRVLHIATHAFAFDSEPTGYNSEVDHNWEYVKRNKDPLARCGLALAGVNAVIRGEPPSIECEDGILSALEASALDLKDTSLVVLSACDTGRGKLHHGEGVLGLRRAFTIAGARTIITSLWQVPDQQTHELMVSFYEGVVSGKTYADALRQAKLKVRRQHAQPLFWSAFVCYGLGTERLN
jgi:CHAT domain-containing protein